MCELVIARQYNSVVASVAKYLMLNSPSTLYSISRYTKIELNETKNALILLVLHDIVRPDTRVHPDTGTQVYYTVLLENILNRLLLPVVLTVVGHVYSKIHSQLLLQFAKYGYLCLEKCVSLTYSDIVSANNTLLGQELIDTFDNEEYAKITLSNALNDLILYQLIATTTTTAAIGVYEPELNVNCLAPLAYRLNLESLARLLYNQEVIENASMRIGHIPVAKTVLLALIANGIPMTPAQIHDYITNCSRDSTITLDYTARILSGLARHPDGVVTLSTKDDYSPEPMYAINVKRSRELMLHRVLFGCIERSCGIMGARIWNLLAVRDNKFWNPQYVSQQALMPLSTVRSLLYSLSLRGYIRIHEISDTKLQSAPGATNFAPTLPAGMKQMQSLHFTSNIIMSSAKIVQDCYKIASNLIHRGNLISNGKINMGPSSSQWNLDRITGRQAEMDLLEQSLLHAAKLLLLLTNSM